MAPDSALHRVGWWAGTEPGDPLAALNGWLLRQELAARCRGLALALVCGGPISWSDPGFTGEPAVQSLDVSPEGQRPPVDVFVASGQPDPTGPKVAQSLAEAGVLCTAVAPDAAWGLEPRTSVGAPFAVPEPALLAARHLPRRLLAARQAYLRVVEGLAKQYVLVEASLLPAGEPPARDLELALSRLAERAGDGHKPAWLVRLAPARLCQDDPLVEAAVRQRRAEAEEARHQPEDWAGYLGGELFPLRVTSPLDLAAAVAGAGAVVAASGGLMALAWALGTPHVAIGEEEGSASDFAAWTGDSSAVARGPADVVATLDNIFARGGRPTGLTRLEATLDEALDSAARDLEKVASEAAATAPASNDRARAEERLHQLETANAALRARMAAERLRFGERAALLEQAAHTTVESAIKAVHGQDVMVRRRLEETEREMRRLQQETAVQQAELRAIHATLTWKALAPFRAWYQRASKAEVRE
jgi:uncharacterized protein with PIN domain